MAKKSSLFGIGTVVAAVTGAIAGAVGMFLSDEDNRKKVGKEIKHVEQVVQKDVRAVRRTVKKVASKAKKATKKAKKRSR